MNGFNEHNHALCEMTLKKLMEDKKIGLTDILVRMDAWTHSTHVNKLGFSPWHLVTGKAVTLPELTVRNVASDNMRCRFREKDTGNYK